MARPGENSGKWWFQHLQYQEGRDSPSEVRNVLLVVAALISAVTFQSGVNPPGGVWQENSEGHHAGRAIYASQKHAFYVFLVFNTLALSTSLLILVSLTHGFPFHLEVWIATVSMIITYGSAVFAVTPGHGESVKFRYILISAAVPFVLRFSIQIFKLCKTTIASGTLDKMKRKLGF